MFAKEEGATNYSIPLGLQGKEIKEEYWPRFVTMASISLQ
jgi:hypothetical protein